jgi:hypothetical protein
METIATKTMLTKQHCCPVEHRRLHAETGLISDLPTLVIAPHHPQLNMGANLGSTTRSPQPQHVVSQLTLS